MPCAWSASSGGGPGRPGRDRSSRPPVGRGHRVPAPWVKQTEVDAGASTRVDDDEHEELKELRKENKELRRANDILQAAASFFGAELDRRRTK